MQVSNALKLLEKIYNRKRNQSLNIIIFMRDRFPESRIVWNSGETHLKNLSINVKWSESMFIQWKVDYYKYKSTDDKLDILENACRNKSKLLFREWYAYIISLVRNCSNQLLYLTIFPVSNDSEYNLSNLLVLHAVRFKTNTGTFFIFMVFNWIFYRNAYFIYLACIFSLALVNRSYSFIYF